SLHVVLTGRLQVRVHNQDGSEKIVAHLSPGESVGEMALFTGASRAATVLAIRDTTLGLLTRDTFDAVMARHPQAGPNFARLSLARLADTLAGGTPRVRVRNITPRTIDQTVNLEKFGRRLQLALLKFGTIAYLNSDTVSGPLGVATDVNQAWGNALNTEV